MELKLEEIRRIFSQFPKIFWLTITGGEPFLRRDLVEIVRTIYEVSKVNVLTITTNGSMPAIIEKNVKEIIRSCKNLVLIVNISIDGNKEIHDKIRGVNGSFDKAVESVKRLKKIKTRRLIVGTNSVISLFNVNHIDKLLNTIRKIGPDSYALTVVQNRARLYNLNLKISPGYEAIREAFTKILKVSKNGKGVVGVIKNFLRSRYYRYVLYPWSMIDKMNFEGIASLSLMSNGKIMINEVYGYVIGDLKKENYNVYKILFSREAKKWRHILSSPKHKMNMTENSFYINQILACW